MRVAVNTMLFHSATGEGYEEFTLDVFLRLAELQPQHQFIFLFDQPSVAALPFPPNVAMVRINRKAKHLLSQIWWLNVKVPMALRKHKADVFVSGDLCSSSSNIPQVLLVHHLAFLDAPPSLLKLRTWFYKTYTFRCIHNAKVVCTATNFLKQEIIQHYTICKDKVLCTGTAAKPIFKTVEWEEREKIKEEFADGCEYFIFIAGGHAKKNLMNVFKAFSIFKRWQKTNMKLLVAGNLSSSGDNAMERLKTFKYRDEVKMPLLPSERFAQVVAGAYALVFPVFSHTFSLPVLQAMQCEVPVITSDEKTMHEVGGEAAMYIDASNPETIADAMKKIFKDEQLRNNLIAAGKLQVQKFSLEKSAELMWQGIQQALSK